MRDSKFDLRIHPAGASEHHRGCMCTLQQPRVASGRRGAGSFTYTDSRYRDLDTTPVLGPIWTQAFYSLTGIDGDSEPSRNARDVLALAAESGIEAFIATGRALGLRAPRRTNHYLRKAKAAAHRARLETIKARRIAARWTQPALPFGDETTAEPSPTPAGVPATVGAVELDALGIHLPRQREDQAQTFAAFFAVFEFPGAT